MGSNALMSLHDIDVLLSDGDKDKSNVQSNGVREDDRDEENEEGQNQDPGLTETEHARRVAALRQILPFVQRLREEGKHEELEEVTRKLGDRSRGVSWRIPFGESGLLDFYLEAFADNRFGQQPTLHTLRVVGNSCADTDENRARVVAKPDTPQAMVNLLKYNKAILPILIPVLFNICMDHGPAKAALYKAGLNPALIQLVSGDRLELVSNSLSHVCKLLSFIASQEPEPDLADPRTPYVLLSLATSTSVSSDAEDFFSLVSVALTYISHSTFQTSFLSTAGASSLFLKAFSQFCSFDVGSNDDKDEAKQFRAVASIFTQALADLSAEPLFAETTTAEGGIVDTPVAKTLQSWFQSPHHTLQSAACLALGNLARSDTASLAFVQEAEVHQPVIRLLSQSPPDVNVQHAALAFLKNLAIPAANKPIIAGSVGLLSDPPTLAEAWDRDVQVQVQFSAVSLARLLVVACPGNVMRFCAILDDTSGEKRDDSEAINNKTRLSSLLAVFKRSDKEPTQTEAARATAAIVKLLYAREDLGSAILPPVPPSSSHLSSPIAYFYTLHQSVPDALAFLATRPKFPTLRSEAWFILALMARCAADVQGEGARVAVQVLTNREVLRGFLDVVAANVSGINMDELRTEMRVQPDNDTNADDGNASSALPLASGDEELATMSQNIAAVGLNDGDGEDMTSPQEVTDPSGVNSKAAGSDQSMMKAIDRENGLVLVAELLRKCPDELAALGPLARFREILKGGGLVAAKERENRLNQHS